MTNTIQDSISRSISEDHQDFKLNEQDVFDAYIHFEAMMTREYEYSCVLCGNHPTVMVYDTFRKLGFRYTGVFSSTITRIKCRSPQAILIIMII